MGLGFVDSTGDRLSAESVARRFVEQVPPFSPLWWLPQGDLQTIIPAYLPPVPSIASDRSFHIHLSDGDRLVIQENDPQVGPDAAPNPLVPKDEQDLLDETALFLRVFDANAGGVDLSAGSSTTTADTAHATAPIALLVHGLGGSNQSPYLVRTAARLVERGWRAMRLDMRGFGESAWTCRGHTHAGRGEDLADCVAAIADRYPGAPIALVGYSLGGNVLLRYLSQAGADPPNNLLTGVAICPPIDLTICATNIRRLRNRLYNRTFTRSLWRLVQQRRLAVDQLHDREFSRAPRALSDFDDVFTAPLHGFLDADDYYAQAGSGPYLTRVEVPTLILAAADDPIIPVSMFDAWPMSDAITFLRTERGGHVGWWGRGGVDSDRWWMDWRVVGWLTNQLERWQTDLPQAAPQTQSSRERPSKISAAEPLNGVS